MSRIGKAPIAVPNGVTVTLKDDTVISGKGPRGELTRSLPAAMISCRRSPR
jgi:large subunit ribosomal protein L6